MFIEISALLFFVSSLSSMSSNSMINTRSYQLTVWLLIVILSFAFTSQGMPQGGSAGSLDPTNYYVVHAKDSTNMDQTTSISKLLKSILADPDDLIVHDSDLGVAF